MPGKALYKQFGPFVNIGHQGKPSQPKKYADKLRAGNFETFHKLPFERERNRIDALLNKKNESSTRLALNQSLSCLHGSTQAAIEARLAN